MTNYDGGNTKMIISTGEDYTSVAQDINTRFAIQIVTDMHRTYLPIK